MKGRKISNILKAVAKQHNTTEKEVRSEIEKAISIGMANTNPKIKLFWNGVPSKNCTPTPEELIKYILKIIETK